VAGPRVGTRRSVIGSVWEGGGGKEGRKKMGRT
jgi:hypothetical protein